MSRCHLSVVSRCVLLAAFLSFWSDRRTITRFYSPAHFAFDLVVSDDRVSAVLFLFSAGHRIKTTLFASDCAIVGLDEIAKASSPLVATRTVSAREFRSLVLGGTPKSKRCFVFVQSLCRTKSTSTELVNLRAFFADADAMVFSGRSAVS